MEEKLTHFDANGKAIMVDVSGKAETSRTAIASGIIQVNDKVMRAVVEGTAEKGDVLGVARVAGIMAAKQTPHLIPMCHPLLLSKCAVDFELDQAHNQSPVHGQNQRPDRGGNGSPYRRVRGSADHL